MATDVAYYKSLSDYEELKEYLDLEKDDFVVQEMPPFAPDFSTAIIVDNIPAIGQEKISKLKKALIKI